MWRSKLAFVLLLVVSTVWLGPQSTSAVALENSRRWAQRYIAPSSDPVGLKEAGDVNGDAIPDLLFASEGANNVVWIVFGSSQARDIELDDDLGNDGFIIRSAEDRYLADSIPAGDVNGDGLDDIIVGDPHAPVLGRGDNTGAAYIIWGKTDTTDVDVSEMGTGISDAGVRIIGANDFHFAGTNVGHANDVNGDGFADVLIAASFAPAVYVVFGGEHTTDIDLLEFEMGIQGDAGYLIRTPPPRSDTGLLTGFAGDVNGDGRPDATIHVGLLHPGDASDYVVYGKADSSPVDVRDKGTWGFRVKRGSLPESMSGGLGGGDVNGDGRDDLMFTFYGLERRALIYVLFGRQRTGTVKISDTGTDDGFRIRGPKWSASRLIGAAIGPKFNRDSIDDLLLVAQNVDHGGTDAGAVYLIYGSKKHDDLWIGKLGQRGRRIDGYRDHLHFGVTAAALSDYDADGIADILVGASPEGKRSRAFLYFSD